MFSFNDLDSTIRRYYLSVALQTMSPGGWKGAQLKLSNHILFARCDFFEHDGICAWARLKKPKQGRRELSQIHMSWKESSFLLSKAGQRNILLNFVYCMRAPSRSHRSVHGAKYNFNRADKQRTRFDAVRSALQLAA